MSEGLKQTKPLTICKYQYYNLRDITIRQLRDNQIITKGNYTDILSRKPDGLILDGKNVLAVIEYKDQKNFNSNVKQKKAIEQSLKIAIGLKTKILVATDGETSIWINALANSLIVDENNVPIKYQFNYKKLPGDEELERLIDKINISINKKNSKIITPRQLDPYNLAKRVWQKIWINTGKEPEKCLYNVVELFIFKFLSDIGVLKKDLLLDFKTLYNLSLTSYEDALTHYANVIRKKISELFPKGNDDTTIINGTIFVTEKGNANLSQARLFCELLTDFNEYEKEYGTFQLIDKNFKTKLFESFLKQSAGIKRLGQFFTPRKIIQAIINMSDVNLLKTGSKICDPFCGVGGFLLEAINLNKTLKNQFKPKNGAIDQKILIKGYDQGTDEKEDERTIILAKANMLIYLSDLIQEYHTDADIKLFSSLINTTFELVRDNLGTLKLNFANDGYDIIFSNPPYVSKGSRSIKDEIINRGFSENFTFNGTGIEGQCIEWIIRNLKLKGQSIIIIPDSILRRSSDLILRQNILKYCYLDALISLPVRSFYATPKKTYIIVLTKKEDENEMQEHPVFSFIVREIGETRDANRIDTPSKNDLTIMVDAFNQFKGNKVNYTPNHSLCKAIYFEDIAKNKNWIIENYWSRSEKERLNILEENQTLTFEDFSDLLKDALITLNNLKMDLTFDLKKIVFKTIQLGDIIYFKPITTLLGFTQKEYIPLNTENEKDIPIFTAQKEAVAYIKRVKSKLPIYCVKDKPHISIASDGDGTAGTNIIIHERDYYLNSSRISYEILENSILPKYLYYVLQSIKDEYGFNYSNKATLQNQSFVSIQVPINKKNNFDIDNQKKLIQKYEQIEKIKENIEEITRDIISAKIILK